jgi:hypothetical protein
VRLIALAGLLAIAYQLWNGELCTMRNHRYVCTAGARAYLVAAALAFVCLGIGAITLSRPRAGAVQKACWILAAASGVLALMV